MQKKTDRRVRKTKSQLRKGLAHLMKEKSIGEITVKELVDEVDINRSTFYLHYSDIPTLLREIEDEMMDEMKRAIHDHPIDRENDSAFSFIKDIFQVLDRNREIGCALIGPYGDIGFIHKMEDLLEENSREVLLQMFPEKSGEMNYFYSYCLNGCLGLVKTWLEDGEDKSPDYAADMTYRMVVSSVKAFYDKKEGREEGEKRIQNSIIKKMLSMGQPLEFISECTDKPVEYIREIATEEPMLVREEGAYNVDEGGTENE